MTRYLRFDNNGFCTGEAPKQMVKDGKLILGYNKPSNEEMLLADGYIRYDGHASLDRVMLNGNAIEELEQSNILEPIPTKLWTKLQIRRSMRELDCEYVLDGILTGNPNSEFARDWADAQEIDLDDPVFKQGLQEYGISQELVDQIIENIPHASSGSIDISSL